MSKFNKVTTRPAVGAGPIVTNPTPTGPTYEGHPGYTRDAKGELLLLAATSTDITADAFYEQGDARVQRCTALTREVAVTDPAWTFDFLTWLRGDGNIRTAALAGAAEAVHARLDARPADATKPVEAELGWNRQIVNTVLQRADEPGEMFAYWTARYGRNLPMPVKRGAADAISRLYTEYTLLRYDTASHGYRFADVIDLCHPATNDPARNALYRYALDRRHGRETDDNLAEYLTMVGANRILRRDVANGHVNQLLNPEALRVAGMTWEDALSLAGNRVDKAKLWEALIPTMGYMSILRNLRNFDQAGVSDEVATTVAARLADPEQVAKSRQLPMRFLSAYRAAPSLRWGHALDQALGHSLGNIPQLGGRTLILVDTSTSMNSVFSKDGELRRWDAAAVFGLALAARCTNADVVSFSSTARYWGDPHGAHTKVWQPVRGESLLRSVERWKTGGYFLGGGTATAAALRRHYAGHDRVVLLTDEQAGEDVVEVSRSVPATTLLLTANLAGYERGHAPGGPNRVTLGGLTDQMFRLIPTIERGLAGTWPWQDGR